MAHFWVDWKMWSFVWSRVYFDDASENDNGEFVGLL